MKVSYLDCDGKAKLFSFNRHDFRNIEIEGVYYMIDGGISTDPDGYARLSGGSMKQGEVKDLIEDIREQFTWGKNYNRDGTKLEKTEYGLLKELDSSHICGILSYFNNNSYKIHLMNDENQGELATTSKSWHIIHEVFIQELDYRIENKLI